MILHIIKTLLRKYKVVLLVAFSPLLVVADTGQNLPDFADSAGSVISPEYEQRLGQLFLKQVRHFSDINTDPEVESYIASIGYKLVSHSDSAQRSFKFFVVNDPVINAFAGPGGIIGINTGVILNSSNESELAAVMAHEISHVTQRHLARMIERHDRYSIPNAAAMVGAILMTAINPEAGTAALASVATVIEQNQLNFTRGNEEEADRIGMQLLAHSEYDPRAMPTFFEKLQQVSRYSQGTAPEFLRTHPLTTSRIADTRARAEDYPQKAYTNSLSYELVRQKLLAGSLKNPKDAIAKLIQQVNDNSLADADKLPARYGLAYAYIRNSDFARAQSQIDILLNDNRDNAAYLLLAAKNSAEQSHYDEALKIYAKAHQLYPDYKPVIVAYSRALLDVKRARKARALLKDYERYYTYDLNTYSLLGQAEAMLGNEIEAAIIQADYYFYAGDTELAIDKLKFIRQQYKLDYYQEERVKARMAELEYELELEKAIAL